MDMRKFKVGDLYYYKDTKSIVKILKEETEYENEIFVESVFSDGTIAEKGLHGYCEISFLYNFINTNKIIITWL